MTLGASLLLAVLVLAGGITAALIAAATAERNGSRASALLVALVWGVLVFAPLAWGIIGGRSAWYADAVGAYDFGGAIPLHIGGGVAALAILLILPRAAGRPTLIERVRKRMPASLALLAITALWVAWLVVLELDLNNFVVKIISNTVILGAASLVAALLVQLFKTGRITITGSAVGVFSGLAAATAACVFLQPIASAVVGAIAGGVAAGIAFSQRRNLGGSLAGLIAVTQLSGGGVGLLMIGLLEESRGFFYTGSFTLPIAQLTAVAVCALYSAIITFSLAFIVARRSRSEKVWAIPDSNR